MKTNVTQLPLMGARIGNRFLQVGEFVPVAALTARYLSDGDLEDSVKLQSLYTAQRATTRTLDRALPLETELKANLVHNLQRVNLEISRYEHTLEFELPTLDPKFLSWRTQTGFPAFSIYRLDSDTTTVIFNRNRFSLASLVSGSFEITGLDVTEGKFDMTPTIPDFMAKHYLDENLRQNLGLLCYDKDLEGMELTAKYGGVMPEHVREKIHKWVNVPKGQPRFDDIFIVAEAPEESWEIKEIPRGDPLVIGVAHGLIWLIDVYDLTPIERFAHDLYANTSKVRN